MVFKRILLSSCWKHSVKLVLPSFRRKPLFRQSADIPCASTLQQCHSIMEVEHHIKAQEFRHQSQAKTMRGFEYAETFSPVPMEAS